MGVDVTLDVLVALSVYVGTLVFIIRRRRPSATPFWLFLVLYTVLIFVGAPLVFANEYAGHPAAAVIYLMLVTAAPALIAVGYELSSVLFGPRRLRGAEAVVETHPPRLRMWMRAAMSAIGLLAALLYVRSLPVVPLLALLKGHVGFNKLYTLRAAATVAYHGHLYLLQIGFQGLLPLGMLWYLVDQRLVRWERFALLVMVVANLLMASLTLQKAPLLILLTGVVLAFYYSGRRWTRLILPLAVGGAVFAVGLVYLLSLRGHVGGNVALKSGLAVVMRVFEGQTQPLFYYVELVPKVIPFLGGRSTERISQVIGFFDPTFYFVNLPRLVYEHAYWYEAPGGIANTVYLGDMYGDFGVLGAMVGSVVVGVLLGALESFFAGRRRTSLAVAALTWASVMMAKATQVDLLTTLSSFDVIWVVLAYVAIDGASGVLFRWTHHEAP